MNTDQMYDLVIIGGGPAGLTAAIYAARARGKVLVIEKGEIGGQITEAGALVNYPGVPNTTGKEVTELMHAQALSFGAQWLETEVTGLELEGDIKVVHTKQGDYQSLAVILATGANPQSVGFKGEKEFRGRGVAYCATCDGEFFTGKDIFVVGSGAAAIDESIFLTKYAKSITILVKKPKFDCDPALVEELKEYPMISVHYTSEIVQAGGDDGILRYAEFKNRKEGTTWRYDAPQGDTFGIFVFAGHQPNAVLFGESVKLDPKGYVITDLEQKTSVDGVYAAGDLCVKTLRQVVTATADGAIAATASLKYCGIMHKKLNLPKFSQTPVHPVAPKSTEETTIRNEAAGSFLTDEIRDQLKPILEKFDHTVILKLHVNDHPLTKEVKEAVQELAVLSAHIKVQEETLAASEVPYISLAKEDGTLTGIAFHGVPSGHEFNSFILAMYNVAGPGQALDEETKRGLEELKKTDKQFDIKILVSLSCTMCPAVVQETQRLAAIADNIKAEMFDLQHFPELKDKYRIMSVPCMVINDNAVYFGKKTMNEIIHILKEI
ncbi:thioredoxin reductase [Veillonellaceae bacterium M2-4]|nr:thioredoxin reductase [Veillonellaceae bacterium M2-4]